MSEWSSDDSGKLVRMRKAGRSWAEIGAALGRSTDSCRGHAQRSGYHDEKEHKGRIRHLEKLVDEQAEAIQRTRRPQKTFRRSPQRPRKGDFCRVIIPDTHGCKIDSDAAEAFMSDLEAIQPREIVMLGDHIDCGGFLAEHHTLGYVAEAEYSFEEDVAAANTFLDEIAKRCPNATVDYLEGNHEGRIEAFCVTKALRNPRDAAYLRKHFSVQNVLSLEKRGIRYYERSKKYDGLRVPGTIKKGKCHFTHGTRTGVHAAAQMLRDFAANVMFGHTHTPAFFSRTNVHSGTIAAWNPGCLCQLVQYWHHTSMYGHAHGYGLQNVADDGDFLSINVPVIEGKSYLGALTQNLATGTAVRRKSKTGSAL